MARQPPKPHYGRKFEISHHAIERFRERVEQHHMARNDEDLANLLDERIQHAERYEDIVDNAPQARDNPTARIYFIKSREDKASIAVVRPNGGAGVCVTVLEESMMKASIDSGVWSAVPFNNTPFRDALVGVRIARHVPAPRLVPSEPPVDPDAEIARLGAEIARKKVELARHRATHKRLCAEMNETNGHIEAVCTSITELDNQLEAAIATAAGTVQP